MARHAANSVNVTLGSKPFIAIENVGTEDVPQIHAWYDDAMTEGQMRAILQAMDAWSEHLHYLLDGPTSPLPDVFDPAPPGSVVV